LVSGRISYKIPVLLVLLVILTNCSVEKNTGTTRFYHGLTSRFNIYFNGYESFKSGLLRIENGYRDDYSELLKVFEFSDPSTVSLCSADMETAIQKASKLISLKSITARPDINNKRDISDSDKRLLEQKEFNEWVDDSYLLIGKARFYKHEYNEASSVFNYCITEANDQDIKTEASLWLARISNETSNYTEANRILNEIDITPLKSQSLRAMYHTTRADMFIRQKRYQEAIDPLSNSIDLIAGKRARYRLTYLLAQLYERSGDGTRATALYREVVKMNPPYDIEFNARINIAGVFDVNSGNPEEIKKELSRMLKDSKNKDFEDQIYFALGNMMMKEKNEPDAIAYYKKSASAPSSNFNQKGKSYLALAEYYYSRPDYMKAGMYYDSVVYFLDQKSQGYQELKVKSLNLNELVSHLTVIQTEDSLQNVASMSKTERDALISGIIEKIIKDESEGRTSEYADRYNMGQYYENERRFEDNISQEGKWYFYNQAALTFGRTEFRRRWGTRRLEDNWRRSNKARVSSQVGASPEENGTNGKDTSKTVADYKKPEFYLINLPLNDTLLAASKEKMAVAYLNAGKVYNEKISDQRKAAEAFESLITLYPDNDLVPEALYYLHRVYREENNQRSEAYRQRLLEKYPDNEFARILSDPEYFNKKTAVMKMVESLYEEAYMAYMAENFTEAVNRCDEALKNFGQDPLAPKFMLLRAYAIAKTSDERRFKEELKRVMENWPGTDESKRAAEVIAYLDQKLPELKVEEETKIATALYVADSISIHSFVVVILNPAFNINQASFDVISYNIDNYTNQNYRTEGSLIDNRFIMITVSGFSDNKEAWDYYNTFGKESPVRNPSGAVMLTFLINNNNMIVFNEDKNPERYNIFFTENYLKGRLFK